MPLVPHPAAFEALKKERDRFVAFAFAAADMLMEVNFDGTIRFADGATGGLIGKSSASLIGTSFEALIVDEDKAQYGNLIEGLHSLQRIDNVRLTLHGELEEIKIPVTVSAFHFDPNDDLLYFSLSVVRNAELDAELRRRDMFTGFLSKDAFIEQANARVREAEESGEPLQLTLLDFPGLKELLMALTSAQARELMQSISEHLREQSVDGDTAGTLGEGATYGLVHSERTDIDHIVAVIGDMIKTADPMHRKVETRVNTLTADVGTLTAQDSARALLYTVNRFAEQTGEQFCLTSLGASYQSMLAETVDKISSFKEIVSAEEFELAFQPIVDIKNGIIHHFECLVRLNDQRSEFTSPFHFITFGEASGLINEFDLLMLQRTINVILDAGKNGHAPVISVNVSGRSLSSSLFMDSFSRILQQNKRIRKQVILEITESSKISDITSANRFVQDLRSEGNLVCLDDFGTGESSFDYLRNLQVDFIKIDGSYVKESLQTKHGRDMLKAMAGLCRSLGVITIGEMVEDEKAAALLWDAGVRFGQGYLFGKPSIDATQLSNCSKPMPYYHGIVRAKRIRPSKSKAPREWWERRAD